MSYLCGHGLSLGQPERAVVVLTEALTIRISPHSHQRIAISTVRLSSCGPRTIAILTVESSQRTGLMFGTLTSRVRLDISMADAVVKSFDEVR